MDGDATHTVTVDKIYEEARRQIEEQGGDRFMAMRDLLNDKRRFSKVLRTVGAQEPGSNCPDFPEFCCH